MDSPEILQFLLSSLEMTFVKEKLTYVELRPVCTHLEGQSNFGDFKTFWLHKIDLRPSLEELRRNLHRDCVQRKIRRAARESLQYEEGRSEALLNKFYGLLLLSRRKQKLPPQPLNWFRNLISCLGEKLKIRVASKNGTPVASILTLRYKDRLVYKYGCSDSKLNYTGGMQLLLWLAIQEAKENGLEEFDLGRSDCDNTGLVNFKNRWGSSSIPLTYWKYPVSAANKFSPERQVELFKRMIPFMPESFLKAAGNLMYKHIG